MTPALRATAPAGRPARRALARPATRRAGELATALLLPTLLPTAACTAPGLPPEFAAAAATAPEDLPARLWLDGDRVIGAAAGLGPGGLPAAVRPTVDAVAPAGKVVFAGREWGPHGQGFRVEKLYADGPDEAFRSVLVAADGSVLERTHSLPIAEVPVEIVHAAMTHGHDVRRCEIVADGAREIGWRATVVDGGGRTFAIELDLAGGLRTKYRLVAASLAIAQ